MQSATGRVLKISATLRDEEFSTVTTFTFRSAPVSTLQYPSGGLSGKRIRVSSHTCGPLGGASTLCSNVATSRGTITSMLVFSNLRQNATTWFEREPSTVN